MESAHTSVFAAQSKKIKKSLKEQQCIASGEPSNLVEAECTKIS